MTKSMPLDQITIADRCRKDLGDIASLASSIQEIGLLQPPVVTPDLRLVAGRRRIAAVRSLGWTEVPVTVVENLDEAVLLLKAERDENTARKDLTPGEAVDIGERLEAMIERPEAEARQRATQARPGEQIGEHLGEGNLPAPMDAEKGQRRDKVGDAVGMSGRSYEKAKAVVHAGREEPEKFGELVEKMDRTGKVDGAYRELRLSRIR